MVQIFIDGASRGNPGLSSCAFVMMQKDHVIHEEGFFLGSRTNNQAEYSALLLALVYALEHNMKEVQLFSDSELLVKQMNGFYRVKSPNLLEYFYLFQSIKTQFISLKADHIGREKNQKADFLCNQVLNLTHAKESEKEVSLDNIRELFKRNIRKP